MSKVIKWFLVGLCIGVVVGIIGVLWIKALHESAERVQEAQEVEEANIKWRQDHFILSRENLYNELIAQGIDFPDIVLAQAILETGHFKSYSCTQKNNLFGIRDSDGTYRSFDHWTIAVSTYKKCIQRYDSIPENYYIYLDKLGYAEDTDYITKLKEIVNKK